MASRRRGPGHRKTGRQGETDLGEFVPLPSIAGLQDHDPSLLGLILSHGHQDHWGLVEQVSTKVPIYIGRATCRILKEAAFFASGISLDRPRNCPEPIDAC